MKRSSLFLATGMVTAMFVGLLGGAVGRAQATSISSGDLIRGESFSAVYYMGADGLRYVFPNDKVYFTWYSNFDTVKQISDEEMATIQIGGNVTYKPGVKMVKIQSDNKTYAVDAGGTLRWVKTEEAASGLYGSTWNKNIDDIPDSFFSNYVISDDSISSASDFNVSSVKSAATNINSDKDLMTPAYINITDDGYSPLDVTVEVNQTVKFTNTGAAKHSVTADDLSWGSGTMQPDGTFIHRFTKKGTYTFYDSYDSHNTGAIYVE